MDLSVGHFDLNMLGWPIVHPDVTAPPTPKSSTNMPPRILHDGTAKFRADLPEKGNSWLQPLAHGTFHTAGQLP